MYAMYMQYIYATKTSSNSILYYIGYMVEYLNLNNSEHLSFFYLVSVAKYVYVYEGDTCISL